MKITAEFDCTQKELVNDIAAIIYTSQGYGKAAEIITANPDYLFDSQHPAERSALAAAEQIFELFYGDSPDYSDDEEEAW